MIPLAFIMTIIWCSIQISCHLSKDITWFSYYLGTVIGLFFSSLLLDIWNKKKRKEELDLVTGRC